MCYRDRSLQSIWIITPIEGWRIIIGMTDIIKSLQPKVWEVQEALFFAE